MLISPAPWLPDVAETNAQVAAVARNVFPGANSYIPVKRATAYSTAMGSGIVPCGLGAGQASDGSFKVVGGSTAKLWRLTGTTWTEAGSGYAATTDERWSFTQFGTYLLAGNINTPLQELDLDAGTSFGATAGTPPQARFWDTVSDFVIAAGLSDDPFAIQWSGINNRASWTPGTLLSDIQTFPDGGRIMNVSAAAGVVVQERKIRFMRRAPGSGLAFQFEEAEAAKGTIAPFSVVKIGGTIGYLAEDGFWFNGEPIGKNAVDQYFLSAANAATLYSTIGTFDPTGSRIIWAYRTGVADYFDKALVYDWRLKRWSEFDSDAFPDLGGLWELSNLGAPGLTLEDLDALYATLEDVPYSLDSRTFLGGRPVLAALGAEGVLAFFEGANAAAVTETGERELVPGFRSLVNAVRPLVDSSSVTVQAGKRDRLADSRTWGATGTMTASGRAPIRSSARYHRFRVSMPAEATWTHMQGVEVENVARLGTR